MKKKEKILKRFTKFQEVFAWSYVDMSGIDLEIAQHHIDTYAHMVPIKQKLRHVEPNGSLRSRKKS